MKKELVVLCLSFILASNIASAGDEEHKKTWRDFGAMGIVASPDFYDNDNHAKAVHERKKWSTEEIKPGDTNLHVHGANVMGYCTNSKCKGHEKLVVCNQLGYGTHEIIHNSKIKISCKCVGCGAEATPATLALNNCWYQMKAIKENGNKSTSPGESVGDECLILDKNNVTPTRWFHLQIEKPGFVGPEVGDRF